MLTVATGSVSADGLPDGSLISIIGVKPGMTKAEALSAMNRSNPSSIVVEGYTSYGNGMLYDGPRGRFRSENIAFFSTFYAVDARMVQANGGMKMYESMPTLFARADCARMRGGESVVYRVHFSPSLRDPRVVLVDEQHAYCSGNVAVRTEIEKLHRRFSDHPTSTLRIRPDGFRVTDDTYGSVGGAGAYIEWRYGRPMGELGLQNRVQMPLEDGWGAFRDFGNPGGGSAVHAGNRPRNDQAYMDTLRVVLWDDAAMIDYGKRRYALYGELDRVGITLARIGDKNQIAGISEPPPPQAAALSPPVNAAPAGSNAIVLRKTLVFADQTGTKSLASLEHGFRLIVIDPGNEYTHVRPVIPAPAFMHMEDYWVRTEDIKTF